MLLGLRIDTRGLEHPDTIGLSPLTLRVGRRGVAFAFRFGVVVFAGVAPADEGPVLDTLRQQSQQPPPGPAGPQAPRSQ